MSPTSRRQFLKATAITAGGVLASRSLPTWASSEVKVSVVPPISLFQYSQVELLEGLFRGQFDTNHKVLMVVDEDGLLKPFRQRQGMPAPGPDLGGWYDNSNDFNPENNFHGFIAGHSFGQYLSGMARAYAVTGDKHTQAKVHRLVRAFGETVEPTGKFYVDYRLPGYTFDKTCCGLIDAHEFAADPLALDVLKRSTDAVLPHLPEKALSRAEQEARPHKGIAYTWDETYTLPENFFLAYQTKRRPTLSRSGQAIHLSRVLRCTGGEPQRSTREACLQPRERLQFRDAGLSCTGRREASACRHNGLRMVQEQSYATGGWGPNEAFVEPGKGLLATSLGTTHSSFETPCGAYGHFKIARYLLRRDA